jgi:hypothetical protein
MKKYPRKQQPAYQQASIVKHRALGAAYRGHGICFPCRRTEERRGAIESPPFVISCWLPLRRWLSEDLLAPRSRPGRVSSG